MTMVQFPGSGGRAERSAAKQALATTVFFVAVNPIIANPPHHASANLSQYNPGVF